MALNVYGKSLFAANNSKKDSRVVPTHNTYSSRLVNHHWTCILRDRASYFSAARHPFTQLRSRLQSVEFHVQNWKPWCVQGPSDGKRRFRHQCSKEALAPKDIAASSNDHGPTTAQRVSMQQPNFFHGFEACVFSTPAPTRTSLTVSSRGTRMLRIRAPQLWR